MTDQPIDLAHLARQAGGDDGLARDVLRIFAERAVADLERLKGSSGKARSEAAHLVVGSARAIGAGEVARLAAVVEAGGGDVTALEAAIDTARRFIATYLAT